MKIERSKLQPDELEAVQDAMRHRHVVLQRDATDLAQRAGILRDQRYGAGFVRRVILRYQVWALERASRDRLREAGEIRAMLRAGREEVYVHRYGRGALHRQAGGR